MKRRIVGIALILVLATALGASSVAAAGQEEERGPALGSAAPDFSLPSVSGEEVSLSELRGEAPVVLIFFRGGW